MKNRDMSKIYVASSWRNDFQPAVVMALREAGHEVYDFRKPHGEEDGFHWSSIDSNWENWTDEEYIKALEHQLSVDGYAKDYNAMVWADTCVMVLPCGASAHSEMGWMSGRGKQSIILLNQPYSPELMYKMADAICPDIDAVIDHLR